VQGRAGKAQHNPAKPALLELLVVSRAAKPHTVGQRQPQQQQQQQQTGKGHNRLQAHAMQCSRAPGNPSMAKPKGNPKGKGTRSRRGTSADNAPTDEALYGALTRVV
jgi:hypothetical protein